MTEQCQATPGPELNRKVTLGIPKGLAPTPFPRDIKVHVQVLLEFLKDFIYVYMSVYVHLCAWHNYGS